MSDVDWEKAHEDLSKAIQAYHDVGGAYCDGWVLISHKRSIELEQQGMTSCGLITARDQSWVLSRGMIEVARENEAVSGYPSP